ncbi:MAG TPA: hemerythrin domain-containing protein [Streptosporangiaceae bacterium]
MDITQLILDDHYEQRRLFAVLEQIDSADPGTLCAVWARLAAFLEVHAAAEEAIFYPELIKVARRAGRLGSAEEETLDAIGDHNDIRDTVAAVAQHAVGSDAWLDAVAAVNRANGDHMAEEEREGLTDFRREASVQRRHDLAVAFARYEAQHVTGVRPVDRDPEAYVREIEESDAQEDTPPEDGQPQDGQPQDSQPETGQSGSLGIGSLHGTAG